MNCMWFRHLGSGSQRPVPHIRIDSEEEFTKLFAYEKLLGKGSFGTVHEVSEASGRRQSWAVKSVSKEKAGSSTVKMVLQEVAIMKRLVHPHIVHLNEVYETSSRIYLVMEICRLGSLDKLLAEKTHFSEREVVCIMRQLMDAIAYIHDKDIIHRDLKVANLLLSEPSNDLLYNVKLSDFGLSYAKGAVARECTTLQVVGTLVYMAPEVILNCGYSQQCDIWSCGVIAFKLLSGDPPFVAGRENDLIELIKEGSVCFSKPVWNDVSLAGKQLIKAMLRVDPAHRITSKEALLHSWLQGQGEVTEKPLMNVLELMREYHMEQREMQNRPGSAVVDDR